jgi:hypothetical protein
VVKHRSQLSFFLEPMIEALPEARNIYLYRDADGWTQSINSFGQRMGFHSEQHRREDLQFMWNIMSGNTSESELAKILGTTVFPTAFEDLLAAIWIVSMRQIMAADTDGNAATAFSYRQLNLEREASVTRLLAACDLDAGHLGAAMAAYDENSQKGTVGTRDVPIVPLSDAQRARIAELTARHPESGSGDVPAV